MSSSNYHGRALCLIGEGAGANCPLQLQKPIPCALHLFCTPWQVCSCQQLASQHASNRLFRQWAPSRTLPQQLC
jgi:hypothetical protein